jgi:hypothetical protein
VRGFSEEMPAFGEALTEEELGRVIAYVQTFCADRSWPRGELNLPRAFFTEKAFPEDEAVSTLTVAAEGPGAVMNEIVYEKRFGARHQIELKVPFGMRESTGALTGSEWNAGVGDIGLGFKSALFHSPTSIFSLGAEVALPTGSESKGFGTGTFVFEPFAAFGRAMGDSFIHLLANVEFGADSDRAESEVGARAVIGRTFAHNTFGRTWTPMLEVLASTELEDAGTITWDLVPQLQVSLSTRQHVLANFGVRVPATDASLRSTQLLFYLLWDWFDGPFFAGW